MQRPKEAISTRNISICGNGGRPRSLGLAKHDTSDTSQTSYQLCALALVRFVSNGERRNSKRNKRVLQIQTPGRQKLHEARKMHSAE